MAGSENQQRLREELHSRTTVSVVRHWCSYPLETQPLRKRLPVNSRARHLKDDRVKAEHKMNQYNFLKNKSKSALDIFQQWNTFHSRNTATKHSVVIKYFTVGWKRNTPVISVNKKKTAKENVRRTQGRDSKKMWEDKIGTGRSQRRNHSIIKEMKKNVGSTMRKTYCTLGKYK